jgi:DNA-binding protein HU-beta
MKHKEFVKQYAQKMGCDEATAELQVQAFIDIVLDSMKNRESVTLEHFGKFYIEDRRDSTVFKFTPSQKLKAILGWSNTYKGEI